MKEEIEYEITPNDYNAFVKQVYFSGQRRRQQLIGLIAGMLFATIFVVSLFWILIGREQPLFMWFVIPIIIALNIYFIRDFQVRLSTAGKRLSIAGNTNGIFCKHKMFIDASGINEQTAVNTTHHLWAGIDRIEENEKYFFIFISATYAHIVPKRYFSSPEKAHEFFALAKNFIQKSRAEQIIR